MVTTSDANSSAATLTELTARLESEGYSSQFGVVDADEIRCYTCQKSMHAAEMNVSKLARTEGVSDPDDEAAIAAITCSNCQTKGTLVLKYGPTANPDEAEVLRLL